jgi:hypothetical protein
MTDDKDPAVMRVGDNIKLTPLEEDIIAVGHHNRAKLIHRVVEVAEVSHGSTDGFTACRIAVWTVPNKGGHKDVVTDEPANCLFCAVNKPWPTNG